MSMQQSQTQVVTMNVENSVIKHYKKQLIHRQHDDSNVRKENNTQFEELTNTKIYDLKIEDKTIHELKDEKKKIFEVDVEKKIVNELKGEKKIKRKRKNRNCRGQFRHEGMELIKLGTNQSHSFCKSKESYTPRIEKPPDRKNPSPKPSPSVIQPPLKPILETATKRQYVHSLPQMVPDRRNSRELQPPPPPPRVPVIYRSPTQPEYHPPYLLPSYPQTPPTLPYRPTPTLPPPPYPEARSPSKPPSYSPTKPRPPLEPVPYTGIHFPFQRYHEYLTTPRHCSPSTNPDCVATESPDKKKRKSDGKLVAAIDLTVESDKKKHKCQCECGRSLNGPAKPDVVISVPNTYVKETMVENRWKTEKDEDISNPQQNDSNSVLKDLAMKIREKEKLPPLFRIDDLLKKGVRFEPKHSKSPEKVTSRVIVNLKNPEKDFTVDSMISRRRQSADVDTVSVSSSGSESVRSTSLEKQIPRGKLFYYKSNNSFIRYFDDTQKKLFIDNITSDGQHDKILEEKEIIELPKDTFFSCKDNLTVEEYVIEMTLVEKFIPKDFYSFYKFVTGYQICNNNLPVSFLTFLKLYNTNGLKVLFERYINGLKQIGDSIH